MTADDVRSMLLKACNERGKKRWAAENGVTANYVDTVISGIRNPGKSILTALGLRREIVYRRAA